MQQDNDGKDYGLKKNGRPKRKPGPKAHHGVKVGEAYEESDKELVKLETLLDIGMPHRQIAIYMGKHIQTLMKHYPEAFAERTKADRNYMVENALFYCAVYKLNVHAQLAWLRAHMHDKYGDKVDKSDNQNAGEFMKALASTLRNADKAYNDNTAIEQGITVDQHNDKVEDANDAVEPTNDTPKDIVESPDVLTIDCNDGQ